MPMTPCDNCVTCTTLNFSTSSMLSAFVAIICHPILSESKNKQMFINIWCLCSFAFCSHNVLWWMWLSHHFSQGAWHIFCWQGTISNGQFKWSDQANLNWKVSCITCANHTKEGTVKHEQKMCQFWHINRFLMKWSINWWWSHSQQVNWFAWDFNTMQFHSRTSKTQILGFLDGHLSMNLEPKEMWKNVKCNLTVQNFQFVSASMSQLLRSWQKDIVEWSCFTVPSCEWREFVSVRIFKNLTGCFQKSFFSLFKSNLLTFPNRIACNERSTVDSNAKGKMSILLIFSFRSN